MLLIYLLVLAPLFFAAVWCAFGAYHYWRSAQLRMPDSWLERQWRRR